MSSVWYSNCSSANYTAMITKSRVQFDYDEATALALTKF